MKLQTALIFFFSTLPTATLAVLCTDGTCSEGTLPNGAKLFCWVETRCVVETGLVIYYSSTIHVVLIVQRINAGYFKSDAVQRAPVQAHAPTFSVAKGVVMLQTRSAVV
ncbi:hypothetical protein B0J12DRAFT_671715 [Macrophomina phaseolina]|uniref:Secreted protein n=1 Tax=Macrophomina phaseolina TaxID=35725 RepID=A0ABQ8G6V9_9PEZI|nr:hypothetical protein B0J12DRAFT_671715 [Macrophomina phaseolina]